MSRRTIFRWVYFVWVLCCSVSQVDAASTRSKKSLDQLNYDVFPRRTAEEAAVLEWGNSAIITALDGAVATFGPQTSRGAFFEVETVPILADPLDGKGLIETEEKVNEDGETTKSTIIKPFKNADMVYGNLVVMSNEGSFTGVQLAQIAKESGAAALVVVNADQDHPDEIHSLSPEAGEEDVAEGIDFPVLMISLNSGNILATASATENMSKEEVINNGMPERIRLYAGGDRPFFEDVSSHEPTLYLIHNLLTHEECDQLIKTASGSYSKLEKESENIMEHATEEFLSKVRGNVKRRWLWRGMWKSLTLKQIDERIEQVTGFPVDHYSDFTIDSFAKGAMVAPHYDVHPVLFPMATLTVFLTEPESGGEIVYPSNSVGPVKITARKGLAIVHHNTNEQHEFDMKSLHADLGLKEGVKIIARKYIYQPPQSYARRFVLPLVAMPMGRMPSFVTSTHAYFLSTFGAEGNDYFDKFCLFVPLFIVLAIVQIVVNSMQKSSKKKTAPPTTKDKKKK
mmetsp:Transcript_37258/g.57210  ORF Transcript_37258/g.57210 Transcript_37258/m.57210 type:complete len:512 (+) Transcript_37258:102-1637(+)